MCVVLASDQRTLKCPADSKNIAGIREVYTNTSSLLKRFLDVGKLPQNFHPRIVTLLSSSTAEILAEKRLPGTARVRVTLQRRSF